MTPRLLRSSTRRISGMPKPEGTKYINTANKYIRNVLPYAKSPGEALGGTMDKRLYLSAAEEWLEAVMEALRKVLEGLGRK